MQALETNTARKPRAVTALHQIVDGPAKGMLVLNLNADLAKQFVELHKGLKANTAGIMKLASEVRERHLTKDGNREKYDKHFNKWWRDNNLKEKIFRSLSNFTKYAKAGELVRRAEKEGYIDKLPVHSMTATYEASLLSDDERARCINPDGKLHAEATAGEIRAWRIAQRPKAPADPTRDIPTPEHAPVKQLAVIETDLLDVAGPFKAEFEERIRALFAEMRAKLEQADEQGEE